MPTITGVYGLLLLLLGIGGYALTGGASVTALIPAAFGLVEVVLAAVARKPSRLKHAMHAAAALGLLALLGSLPGVPKLMGYWAGATLERPAAAISQSIMALLSAVFVGLCIASFVQARRTRGDTHPASNPSTS